MGRRVSSVVWYQHIYRNRHQWSRVEEFDASLLLSYCDQSDISATSLHTAGNKIIYLKIESDRVWFAYSEMNQIRLPGGGHTFCDNSHLSQSEREEAITGWWGNSMGHMMGEHIV